MSYCDDITYEEYEPQVVTDVENIETEEVTVIELDEVEDIDAEETFEFPELEPWQLSYKEHGISDEAIAALSKSVGERNYMDTELVDLVRNPDYEGQRSILTDLETGLAVRDENGDFVDCPRNTKGAQRPDGMYVDELGDPHFREAKNYGDVGNLISNIKEQTETRREGFGDDVDITYVIDPSRFTVKDADKLQALEDELGINIEFQLK
ncbi:MAG: hypothetical protein J6V50_03160 [Clostridia bacterium]|nr:hypothetical protein [Clostridia bacterium]